VKKCDWIRCVGLFALLGITLILASCGGGGGRVPDVRLPTSGDDMDSGQMPPDYDFGQSTISPAAVASWTISVPPETGKTAFNTSIAVLPDGSKQYLAYYDVVNKDLKLATRVGSSWQIQTLAAQFDSGKFNSMVLDPSGKPVISYYQTSGPGKMNVWWNGAITIVDNTNGDFGAFNDITYGNGSNHYDISYSGQYVITNLNKKSQLKHAWFNGSSWQNEVIEEAPDSLGNYTFTSIAMDASGTLHISYRAFPNGQLKHAWGGPSSWRTEEVLPGDPQTSGILQTNMLADAYGKIHIIYSKPGVGGGLFHVWKDGVGPWQKEMIAGGYGITTPNAATVDPSGNIHIAAYKSDTQNLVYITLGNAWDFQWVDSGTGAGTGASITWDAGGWNIGYLNNTQQKPKTASASALATLGCGPIQSCIGPIPPERIITDSEGATYPVSRILVDMTDNATEADARQLATQVGGMLAGHLYSINMFLIEVPARTPQELDSRITAIRNQRSVEGALRSFRVESTDAKSSCPYIKADLCLLSDNSGGSKTIPYETIKIFDAWKRAKEYVSGSPVTVGVIDSGVDMKHPEFSGIRWGNSQPDDKVDSEGHGTSVAGIILANNRQLTTTLFWPPEEMNGVLSGVVNENLYVLESRKKQAHRWSEMLISEIESIATSSANPKVINMSLGCPRSPFKWGTCSIPSNDFLEAKTAIMGVFKKYASVLFVVSAGNLDIPASEWFPAAAAAEVQNGLTVGATDATGQNRANWGTCGNCNPQSKKSAFGPAVSIAAPGERIFAPSIHGGYDENFGGTSGAAPLVSGTAALLRAIDPNRPAYAVKQILIQSAQCKTFDQSLGIRPDCSGNALLLDADGAVAMLLTKKLLTVKTFGAGNVVSVPLGIDCGVDCVQGYPPGTQVTLTANPAPGYQFSYWSYQCFGSTPTTVVTMNADIACDAHFTQVGPTVYLLTANKSGNGKVTSNPGGIDCGSDCYENYNYGTVVTLTATPDPGWNFLNWSGDCSGTANSTTVTMNATRNCIANFNQLVAGTYTLSVSKIGSGTITSSPPGINCGSDCSENYNTGTLVTITGNPDPDWKFVKWTGNCSGINPSVQVTMNANKACTAQFVQIQWNTLTVANNGNGSVRSNPQGIICGVDCSEVYTSDTVVTLTADPGPGWKFTGWSGDCSGTAPAVQVTMSANRSCTANYQRVLPTPYTLRVTRLGNGTVTSNPTGIACGTDCTESYPAGTVSNLTATPDPGWQFVTWSGDCSGTNPYTQVTLNANRVCTASFDLISQPSYAYVAASDAGGFRVINVSNPASPVDAGSYATPGFAEGVFVSGNYAYVADAYSAVHVMDVRDPTNPTRTGVSYPGGPPQGVFVAGDYAYVASEGSGLRILSISDPANPILVGYYGGADDAQGVFVVGNLAYVADQKGLTIVDVGNPSDPRFVGDLKAPDSGFDVFVSGKYAYLAASKAGLVVVDVSNPAAPRQVGRYATPGVAYGVSVSGHYAFVTNIDNVQLINHALLSIDISNPASPRLAGSVPLSGPPYDVFLSGRYAYVADGSAGLQIFDVAVPSGPSWVGSIGTQGYAFDVFVGNSFGALQFSLTVNKTGNGMVTSNVPGINCGSDCSHNYDDGTWVTLTAAPDAGWHFSNWSGDCTGTDAVITAVMINNKTCTATFAIGSPPSWQVWVVDEAGDAGRSPSLAFAPDGNPSISYHTWIPTYDLKYAHWNGTIWDLIVVEDLPANSDPNDGTSLAFDGGGNPSISYLHHIIPQSFNGKLWFAQKSGSSWALQQIPDSDAVGQHSSLRYDSSGYPVIAYHQFIPFSGGVKQARWTGSNWQVEYVDTDPGEVGGVHTSLALDTANTPHISYGAGNGANQGELRYATWTGSAWAIQVVDSGIGSIYPLSSIFTSIALDSAGRPRIAYRDAIRGDLKFAQWTGSAWIIETIDSADDVGWWCSLVIDASGNSWISYYDVTTQSVKLAVNRGSGWEISTIDSGLGTDGNLGYTSLALDHAGNPAIAYYDAVNGDLKLAWFR